MGFKTDYARVQGLGSAKDGTHHFWQQRVSSIALIILTPFVIFTLAVNLGDDFAEMRAAYAHPFTAITTGLFILMAFFHLKLGLQVVIEDYISGKGARAARNAWDGRARSKDRVRNQGLPNALAHSCRPRRYRSIPRQYGPR